jgi:SAM-dependent methyltransferase
MIRVARLRSAKFDNLEFRQVDAVQWDFPQSHFDFACSIATLHHLPQRELLVKMREALKPSGVLVVLDLVGSHSLSERLMDVMAVGVSGTLRLVHNGRLKPPAEVRKAWEQHGTHDHYSSVQEMRALADDILPGSIVTRRLLWRYMLVYQKPTVNCSLPPENGVLEPLIQSQPLLDTQFGRRRIQTKTQIMRESLPFLVSKHIFKC